MAKKNSIKELAKKVPKNIKVKVDKKIQSTVKRGLKICDQKAKELSNQGNKRITLLIEPLPKIGTFKTTLQVDGEFDKFEIVYHLSKTLQHVLAGNNA